MEPHEVESGGRGPANGIEELIADCLRRMSLEGDAALSAVCADNTAQATAIRRGVTLLRGLGLLEPRDSDPPEPEFPERLGEFRLIRRLGGGGMGVVFLAEQESQGRLVAVKIVRPESLFFSGARDRFRREIEAVARLQHPGIVSILAVGEDKEIPYFAMEWIAGCSLADVLRTIGNRSPERLAGRDFDEAVRRLEPNVEPQPRPVEASGPATWVDTCVAIASKVASALAHAHERGVIHRDVKPSNILVTASGRVALADFGLASLAGATAITRTGVPVGSLPYMSPEQIQSVSGELDRRTDVYSLGVTLYEMLTLRAPFVSNDAEEIRRLIAKGDSQPIRLANRAVRREVETVCLKAMDRDPSRRYASAHDLARDLDRLRLGQPISARPLPVIVRARRWIERHPLLAVASTLLAVLAVVSLLYLQKALSYRAVSALSKASYLSLLRKDADAFWPADPVKLPAMFVWLEKANDARRDADAQESVIAALRRRAQPYSTAERLADLRQRSYETEFLELQLERWTRVRDALDLTASGVEEGIGDYKRLIAALNSSDAERMAWGFATIEDRWQYEQSMGIRAEAARLVEAIRHVEMQVRTARQIMTLRPLGEPIESITLRSGTVDGRPGRPLERVTDATCIWAESGADPLQLEAFKECDFERAAKSDARPIVNELYGLGLQHTLISDPDARFVNWAADDASGWGVPARSALYAHRFTVGTPDVSRAILSLRWAVDDTLGGLDFEENRAGAYLNGKPLGEAFRGGNGVHDFEAVADVTELVLPGLENVLYLYQRDHGGGMSGLIYSATLEIWPASGSR